MENYKDKYIKYKKKYILQKKMLGGRILWKTENNQKLDNFLKEFLTEDILFFDIRENTNNEKIFNFLKKLEELNIKNEVNELNIKDNEFFKEFKFEFESIQYCIDLIKNNIGKISNLEETINKGVYYNNNEDALNKIFEKYFDSKLIDKAPPSYYHNYELYLPIVFSKVSLENNHKTIDLIKFINQNLYERKEGKGIITIKLFIDDKTYKIIDNYIKEIPEIEISNAITKRIEFLICKYKDINYINTINKEILFKSFFPTKTELNDIYMASENCEITQKFLENLTDHKKIHNSKYYLLPNEIRYLYRPCYTNIFFKSLDNYQWCYNEKKKL